MDREQEMAWVELQATRHKRVYDKGQELLTLLADVTVSRGGTMGALYDALMALPKPQRWVPCPGEHRWHRDGGVTYEDSSVMPPYTWGVRDTRLERLEE